MIEFKIRTARLGPVVMFQEVNRLLNLIDVFISVHMIVTQTGGDSNYDPISTLALIYLWMIAGIEPMLLNSIFK